MTLCSLLPSPTATGPFDSRDGPGRPWTGALPSLWLAIVTSLFYELGRLGHEEGIVSVASLSRGAVNDAWLVGYADGSRLVAKTSFGAPEDMFIVEAEGLRALAASGHVATVGVVAASERLLLLEALETPVDDGAAWERLGRELASLHSSTAGERFGWETDGYLGWLPQLNPWSDDGHRFYAEQRLLRYLGEPGAETALEPADREALERLCQRLPDIVPTMPPVLTHGDLWSGNLLSGPKGRLVLADPAVSYTWGEVDLSMLWCSPRPSSSERFFAAYEDVNPLASGWQQRMPILFLREVLSTIAHFAGPPSSVAYLREALAPFYVVAPPTVPIVNASPSPVGQGEREAITPP